MKYHQHGDEVKDVDEVEVVDLLWEEVFLLIHFLNVGAVEDEVVDGDEDEELLRVLLRLRQDGRTLLPFGELRRVLRALRRRV